MASKRVVLPLWKGPTSAMHRGPKLLVPLGPLSFCPIIASLAGREVGPGFPALLHYRLRTRGGWQERFVAAEKSLLDETRINDIACADGFVDPALCLVPGDLAVDVSDIKLRLRIDKVGACLAATAALVPRSG